MKLPDFSTFKPLNENREQMNADMPDNLSFVTIDDRVTNADLETKRSGPVAPAQARNHPASEAATGEAQPKARPQRVAATHVHYNNSSLGTVLLVVQAVMLLDIGIAVAAFSYFGVPWATTAAPAGPYPLCAMAPAKSKAEEEAPSEPFYKRNEYTDKFGVRHTIIEQLPVNKP